MRRAGLVVEQGGGGLGIDCPGCAPLRPICLLTRRRRHRPPFCRGRVSVAAEDLAFIALSMPTHRAPPPPADAATFLTGLAELCSSVADGTVSPPGAPVDLPGFPRTLAAVAT